MAAEPDRWIVTDPEGKVTVFETALGDDHLVLTHDADDARDTADRGLVRLVAA